VRRSRLRPQAAGWVISQLAYSISYPRSRCPCDFHNSHQNASSPDDDDDDDDDDDNSFFAELRGHCFHERLIFRIALGL
jgi:hypothetical protein